MIDGTQLSLYRMVQNSIHNYPNCTNNIILLTSMLSCYPPCKSVIISTSGVSYGFHQSPPGQQTIVVSIVVLPQEANDALL